MDERIIALEERLAYQDKALADLDDVVQGLARQVDQLDRKLSALTEWLRNPGQEVGPPDERPPHY